jgi:fatty-acyl-CoA synthase
VARDGKQTGEVILRGDAVMKGYWNKPEETAEVLKQGWFYTGDLATMDEAGYLYIVDRKKDIIISGGINISAREIEEVIHALPTVAQCAVIGVPHGKWGETPKAVITLREGVSVTEKEVIDHCRRRLASFKLPTSVDFVLSLPMTASGKISKNELRETYKGSVKTDR